MELNKLSFKGASVCRFFSCSRWSLVPVLAVLAVLAGGDGVSQVKLSGLPESHDGLSNT